MTEQFGRVARLVLGSNGSGVDLLAILMLVKLSNSTYQSLA